MKKIGDLVKVDKDNWNDLKQDFVKDLQKNDFVEVINQLDMQDEDLVKYTLLLETAASEFGHCKNCKGLDQCKNEVKGYLYKPRQINNHLQFEYLACQYQQKREEELAYKENVTLFETPKTVKSASFKNTNRDDRKRLEISKYFKKFMEDYMKGERPKGLYLHGSFGTGKTYLIAALFNELAKNNVKSAIVYVPEFLRLLKTSFNTDYPEKYDYIKTVPLLLLDDIGAENLTPWARDEIIGTLLQYRMEENLPTFFTSNLNIQQLEEHFSATNSGIEQLKARRIVERITFMTTDFELTSKNRRSKINEEV